MNKETILGLLIPFLGTTLGSAMVFVMKDELNPKVQKGLSGFAAGVMVAASIWSLLIPAMDMVEENMGRMSWIPAVIGFIIGILFYYSLIVLYPTNILILKRQKVEMLKT